MMSKTNELTVASLQQPLSFLRRLQDLEGAHQSIVDTHHGASVVELTTVVGCREDGDQLSSGKELVTILNHLVGTANQVQIVSAQELSNHIFSKSEGHTSVILTPADNIFIRVRPQQITEQASVRNISRSHNSFYQIHILQLRTQTSMHAQNLLLH